jgi:Lysyl oxidase
MMIRYPAIMLVLFFGCGENTGSSPAPSSGDDDGGGGEAAEDPGALVRVSMKSKVGVVLDEIPESLRDQAAAFYLAQDDQFWRDRAEAQIRHTTYRLVYRNFYYENKGQLSLPPSEVWNIEFASPGPVRRRYQGHDAVLVDYELLTTLLSDRETPEVAEPRLRRVGGEWREPFSFPLDPEYLFQRTGYACMDEEGYPLGTAESENAWQLFDQDCEVEVPGMNVCHITEFPNQSCREALRDHTGRVNTHLRFERLRWDDDLADEVRVASYASTDGPNIEVIGSGLDNHRIVWRYIHPESCTLAEQCVGGTGWRRLLEFDASIRNASPQPLTVGEVSPESPFVEHNNLIFSSCHEHYHYSHYGDFRLGDGAGDKRAFCIESTDRYFNSEDTPLVHPYGCDFQGVASGWGDTYIAGIECNWIDITDFDIPAEGLRADLSFRLNPDDFICEGAPVLDDEGNQVFEPTDLVGENGMPIDRPLCEFVDDFADNNFDAREVELPAEGGFITTACTRQQAGPLRDCGWQQRAKNLTCEPGQTVTLKCKSDGADAPQALRICEASHEHGAVIACMFREALASAIVGPEPTEVTFLCPEPRSETEPGGLFGYFDATVLPDATAHPVSCEVVGH